MLKKILFFIIVIFGLCFIQAQEPISIHITEKDGLPDIEFYSILEDSKGFIWLASESGLYRYDGKSYIQYSNDEKRGLSVFDLSEDEQGRVWCTNISGQFFYIENNKLITFIDLKDELKGQLGKFQVQGKDLIITTIGASYFIDLATKKIRKKKLSYKHGLHLIRDNDIYVSIDFDSIKVLSNDYKVINHFPLDSNYYSDNLKIRGKTHFFKLNEIFFFSQQLDYKNRFTSVNISTGEIRLSKGLEAIEATRIISIKIIGSQLWVLTYKGAYIYEYVNSEFILKNKILKTEKITDVIIDKDQNYWVSTLANGIYLIPNIEVLKHHLPESSNDVMAINKVNDSTVFFGSKKGEVGLLNINTSAYKLSTDLRSKVSAIQ
ncbi:MAG: two-component regulator propeller domain-containing protein, partial [Winogradskyella arenosi]